MRRISGSICILALLAPVSASPQQADPKTQVIASQAGFCRTPAPLPRLAPEDRVQGQNQVTMPVARSRAAEEAEAAEEGDDIVVTAARRGEPAYDYPTSIATAEAPVMAPPPPAPPPPPASAMRSAPIPRSTSVPGTSPVIRPPQPQAGLLTAGEHDDLLNPELYAEYVRTSGLGQRIRGLPMVDTARLLTVTVRDDRGQAVPFAPVEVRCADGNSITLKTMADGSAVFFPGLDQLSEVVQVRAPGSDWREVRLATGAGTQALGITSSTQAAPVRRLDLALAVDVTGSMGDEIRFLQSELRSIIDQLARRHRDLDIRIGFVFYRDRGDNFITRTVPFATDVAAAQRQLAGEYASGGGDTPEALQDAMVRAAGLDWRPDAVKTLLLVADAPPHDEDFALSWLATEHLRASRVHIVPVGASGVEDRAQYLMRAMAAATQSRYTFLTDDSGIGNAHAAPAIDCYLVTRLDQLLRRVIDSQISGRRIEPEDEEVIRRVGQYDAGRCILPPGYPNGQEQGKRG